MTTEQTMQEGNPFGFDSIPDKELHHGWSNYETYNVALQTWVNESSATVTYKKFIETTKLLYLAWGESGGFKANPDGVSWTDENLNHTELDAMFEEVASDDFELEEYTMAAFNTMDKTPILSRDWRSVFKDNPLYKQPWQEDFPF